MFPIFWFMACTLVCVYNVLSIRSLTIISKATKNLWTVLHTGVGLGCYIIVFIELNKFF